MKVGVSLFLFVDIINFNLYLLPCRKQIKAFYKLDDSSRTTHVLTTLVVIVPATLIVILYPDIISLFGICGGVFCLMVGWIIPYLIKIRIYGMWP